MPRVGDMRLSLSGYQYVERLSHRQQELTPPLFAEYSLTGCDRKYGSYDVAVLWLRPDSPYWTMPGVHC